MLNKITNFLKNYQLPILSGILIGTSYIPFPPYGSIVGLVPLWYFIQQQTSLKKIFIGSWLTQFILTLIGFNWVSYTIHKFGKMPIPIAIIGLLLFCCIAHLYIPLASVLWHWLSNRKISNKALQLLSLPFLFWLCESYFPVIFPWNLGYTWLWAESPLAHIAEWIGFAGISLMIMILNLVVLYYLVLRKQRRIFLMSFVLIFLSLNLFGLYLKKNPHPTDSELKVLIVQANIGNLQEVAEKKGYGFRNYIINEYKKLTLDTLKNEKVDFFVWPESAYPDLLFKNQINNHNARSFFHFLQENKIAAAIGGYSEHEQNGLVTNSFFTFNEKAEFTSQPYHKTHLLAFGEYIPGAKWFPFLKKIIPASEFGKGPGPQVMNLNGHKIGPQICYESLFPHFSQQLAKKGAEVIINVTNDSWYGTWQEPHQHLYMTLARAIEFRRPLIRSTNTGITTAILADGTILKKSPMDQKWGHIYKIKYSKKPKETFYQRFFWLLPILSTVLLTLILGTQWYGKFKDS